ncbi:MAG: type II toxin-antitoxin system VapC family toxin [Steroidobacteraceae bacterium]|nr:type II toxin-antitoxin system VapC family toxin [Steroidobacteraceae bacterium]
MVIDSSAILAVLLDEPEARALIEAIDRDPTRLMSVASLVECSIVLTARFGADGVRNLDLFVARAGVNLVAVDVDQAYVARQASRNYGKGRHAASLNFGDCFSYALSRTSAEPLLFKGADFALTDVDPVIPATAP